MRDKGEDAEKMSTATAILHRDHPDLIVDGEIQANFAINQEMLAESFPFSQLNQRKVNILIFPNLSAGNISYKLLKEMGGLEAQGPVLLGMKKSVHILQMGSSAKEIVDMVRLAVVDAAAKNARAIIYRFRTYLLRKASIVSDYINHDVMST